MIEPALTWEIGSRSGSWIALCLFAAWFGALAWGAGRALRRRGVMRVRTVRVLGALAVSGGLWALYASSLSGFYEAEMTGDILQLRYLSRAMQAEVPLGEIASVRPIPWYRGAWRLQVQGRSGRCHDSATAQREVVQDAANQMTRALAERSPGSMQGHGAAARGCEGRGIFVAVLSGAGPAPLRQDAPADYPQWRGSRRDGGASAFTAPAAWPEQLTRVWSTEVGQGYATPLVVGDLVYAFTTVNGREGITGLDAHTGARRWRTDYPIRYETYEDAVDHGDGPKATPLYHRGRLYTLGISGAISSFDAVSGAVVWQKPAPQVQPELGTAASPLADGDVVIVQEGYEALTAFEADTGRVRWTAPGQFRYGSPILGEWLGTRQIVIAAQHAIVGIDAADGRVLWEHPWKSPDIQAITPTLYRDTIIVSGHHRGVMALRPVRSEERWSVEVVWKTDAVSLFMSNPVVMAGALFGLSHRNSGQYFALDAGTGQVLWLGPPRQAFNTAVVKADDVVFLLDEDGEMTVARGGRAAFEPLRRYRVADGETWAQPAVSGRRIFVKAVSSLALWTVD